MPKSKHRRKGKNRSHSASLSGPASDDPALADFLADAESDGAFDASADDPEMAKALAQAEAELAAELAAADGAGDLGPDLGDPPEGDEFDDRFDRVAGSLRAVVEGQLRANEPPEVAATLARLLAAGHDRDQAVALIGAALMVELNEIMRSEREFDPARYARNLANLPALPDLG
jgi:hypothetical protein